MEDVPLATVRGALGGGRWIARPGGVQGWAALVGRDNARPAGVSDDVPLIAHDDDAVLQAMLRAFGDGALISTHEGEALAWIEAIRAEEVRNQADATQRVDARVEELQARIDELEAYASDLNAHVAAIEGSRAWHLSRRLVAMKARVVRVLTLGRR